ncbi:hypothetical protein Nepgr_003631 [Nepenthes gracilis]|uniref:Uncharacterized protein n=1 Tax=Nepenthes gracilis TaxID=150966 RepID=A0AAD3RZY0_NEPGR|nr:hypothetical protein Nepgr_003631 [Nepenthes gracilis]
MATQTDGSSSDFSAEVVGHAFVSQFYHILHATPDVVCRFYQDSSTMSRPGPDGSLTTVTTMKGINDLILSLDSKDYKSEILTADAQASYMEGVIVLVTGCLTGKDNVRRKFTESFFLAPQDKGYFVLNDTFRFVDEDRLSEDNPLEVKDIDKDAPAAPCTPDPETTRILDNSQAGHAIAEGITDSNVESCLPSENEERSVVIEGVVPQVVSSCNDVQPVVGPVSNAHEDTPKKSYASIVKDMKDSAGTTYVPTSTARTSASNAGQQSSGTGAAAARQQSRGTAEPVAGKQKQGAAVSAVTSESSANGNNGRGCYVDQAEDKGFSIYIGNLPIDATTELVELEFLKFGPIKRGGIQVRGNRGFCFGFVEFESLSSMQNALKVSRIRIGGHNAFIEEKKTTTRVNNGLNSPPSVRSGYHNDSFRGRGNFSSGRGGYGNNDYGRRREFSNGARNGDGYQRVYQNGGSRGGRQGGTK